MLILILAGIAIHLISLASAIQFFRSPGASRDADKTIVATLGFASVMSLAGMAVIWYWNARFNDMASISDKVNGAIFFFNGVLYLTLTRSFAQHRSGRCPFDGSNPTKR